MPDIPRYAIVPTFNRPKWLGPLVTSLAPQCDAVVVLDNASEPPVDMAALNAAVTVGGPIYVIRDEEQPPHLSRFWNVMFDFCEKLAAGAPAWDVAVLNDDALVPFGWFEIVAEALREHLTAVVAHTGTGRPVREPLLMTDLSNEFDTRMCPHAFVIRGEVGLRADESMRWWWFDTDLDWRARQAGGVLAVPGPRASNGLASESTKGPLLDQARLDDETFQAKWGLEQSVGVM